MSRLMLRGIIPATITPFTGTGEVDESALAAHVRILTASDGVEAIMVNGHTGEILSLSPEERRRTVQIARQVAGSDKTVIAGVHAQSTREAVEHVRAAREAGADAAMIFSPFSFARGAFQYPHIVLDYYQDVARDGGLPILVMQYPAHSGLQLPQRLLLELIRLDGVVGVKHAAGDIVAYEEEYREIKATAADVAVLTAYEGALFAAFAIGCDGALIGFANFPEPIVAMYRAARAGDLATARQYNDRLYPLSRAIYGPPSFRWSSRLKYALHRSGRLPNAVVRPPLQSVTDEEAGKIDRALVAMELVTA